ncbi:MAG: phosphoribosylformylglycinamidine synthase I [candidate division KSB1 bacterium]|nr:phosphoribosylformylglycinamidine synthase I [candidate division KSB1 bacterium]
MTPRALVLRAAGSNCDIETKFAFDSAGGHADLVHINRLLDQSVSLKDYQILVVPGGFTYGDDISAGKVLANQLKNKLHDQLYEFHEHDKLILGICNGFQVLIKSGLLPKIDMQAEQQVTLAFNDSGKFEDRWVHLSVNRESPCVFTRDMKSTVQFPVANAEGKLVAKNHSVLQRLKKQNQIVFQYTNPNSGEADYPYDPSASMQHIAGICDPTGRILGLMPHPERHFHPTHHPQWTRVGLAEEGDGVPVFKNAVNYFYKQQPVSRTCSKKF